MQKEMTIALDSVMQLKIEMLFEMMDALEEDLETDKVSATYWNHSIDFGIDIADYEFKFSILLCNNKLIVKDFTIKDEDYDSVSKEGLESLIEKFVLRFLNLYADLAEAKHLLQLAETALEKFDADAADVRKERAKQLLEKTLGGYK